MNHAYQQALKSKNIRPVLQPQVELKKFVPFTVLEFSATVEILGDIVLADYRKSRSSHQKSSSGRGSLKCNREYACTARRAKGRYACFKTRR